MPNYYINDLRNNLIKIVYKKWHKKITTLLDGYTILLPTPHDLPIFLKLALEIIKKQDLTHMREILIIPDWPSKKFSRYYETLAAKHPTLPLRLINLTTADQLAWILTKSITTRHFTQLIRGIDETTTKYAILHDSDLFLPPGNFLETQYKTCSERNLSVYGVEPRLSMIREDRNTFVATWEMTFSIQWAKSFSPAMHKGQISIIKGRRQEFDTTLLPQYLTDSNLIDYNANNHIFYHFRYVIATYRNMTNNKPLKINYGLKLFLIRTLIDIFEDYDWKYDHIPEHQEFIDGKYGLSELLSHQDGNRLLNRFKNEFEGIIYANIFNAEQNNILKQRLESLLQSLQATQIH
jgi:hypothetical protein